MSPMGCAQVSLLKTANASVTPLRSSRSEFRAELREKRLSS